MMTTVTERRNVTERPQNRSPLTDRVERDLADALSEFGSQIAHREAEQATNASPLTFGYHIPMAGVRYYTYAPRD